MNYTLKIYEAADGWRWRIMADNNKIVADSGEAYVSRANAERAAKSLTTATLEIEEL